jgi:transcriptional antiterminator RfaH
VSDPQPNAGSAEPPSWYCLRSQPKHEHIAAAHVRELGFEVFLPRIRFKRSTRRGAVWFTEALFPGYFFARFCLASSLRLLHHTHGVQGVVHFGDHWPTLSEGVVAELRASLGNQPVHTIPDAPQPGENVVVSGGAFHGLTAVVSRVMPSRQRVAVLLDFLGRQTAVDLPWDALVREAHHRRTILGPTGEAEQDRADNQEEQND